MNDGALPFQYHVYDGAWHDVEAEVIAEGSLTLFVNGRELASLMCTPQNPLQLAVGFLANEGFVESIDEIEIAHICAGGSCADVWLSHPIPAAMPHKTITSGCSGGQTFADLSVLMAPPERERNISPERLGELIVRLQNQDSLYARARGVHTSALSDGSDLLIVAEDIGRHNTLDRLRGECLLRGLDPSGMILLSTGRISSEMIYKAALMGCPIVASRTSPTSLSVALARAWKITLCGYLRRSRMNVYACPERLIGFQPSQDFFVVAPPVLVARDRFGGED
jgi:FdhD protein